MGDRILITGGAGFIGCHVAARLLRANHQVRILDSFIEQVHPPDGRRNPVLRDTEIMVGDVRDPACVKRALRGVDKVIHLAAEVGVGQSMYAIERYVAVNDVGTAVLCQQLIDHRVERTVVASSMSVYGEGLYETDTGTRIEDAVRTRNGTGWDPVGPNGSILHLLPAPESRRPNLASVYALTKYVQERLVLTVAAAYGMQAVALRLFNVYGAGQSLSNPYTGVLAIFASRLLNAERPLVFEDGRQRRDFVHVDDVARAFELALTSERADAEVLNIGSSRGVSIGEVATRFAAAMGHENLTPEIVTPAARLRGFCRPDHRSSWRLFRYGGTVERTDQSPRLGLASRHPANAISLRELIGDIEQLIGGRIDVSFAPWREGDQRYFVADARAAREALRLPDPLAWRRGIARLAAHFGAGRTPEVPLVAHEAEAAL